MFSRGGRIETEWFQGGECCASEASRNTNDDFVVINAVGAIIGLIIFLVDSKIPPISFF